jgi:hypothetical protein
MNAKPQRPMQERENGGLRFLGEQDGVPERELKERLSTLFSENGIVHKAYLSRVKYVDSAEAVALCVCSHYGAIETTVERVGSIFAEMFGPQEHLDIIVLDESQEAELATCCSPFFER